MKAESCWLILQAIIHFFSCILKLLVTIYLCFLLFLAVAFRLYDLRQTGFIEREDISTVFSFQIFFLKNVLINISFHTFRDESKSITESHVLGSRF